MSVYVGQKHLTIPLPLARQWQVRVGWNWATVLLLLLSSMVALLMLLPPIYLTLRALEAPDQALAILVKPTTLQALLRTLLLALSVTLSSVLVSLPIAWLLECSDVKHRRFWSVTTALPLVLPSYVVAYLFVSILGPRGILQQWLQPFGIEQMPSIYGFFGAALVLTLLSYPYVLLSVRAALRKLDPSLVEAARSLGVSPRRALLSVVLPHLRPSIVAGSLLVTLYVVRDFGAVSMLRYNTFTRIIYIQYQSFSSRALAASLGLVLIALTGVLLWIDMRTRSDSHYARQSVGAVRQAKRTPLGRWQLPAQLMLGLIVLWALVVPLAGLGYWLVRGLASGEAIGNLWRPATGSFVASLGAALVAVLAALPVALLSVRHNSRFSRWIERITYTGFALPGIVVALALSFFSVRYLPSLYQTVLLLIAAYVILFIPQVVGAARASLLQQSPSLAEAGRSLGLRSTSVFRLITLPLAAPGVVAGGALVFLTCMKELPATLIVSPLGYEALSIEVWSNISEAFFAAAAAPSLLLILLSSVPLALLTLRYGD